MSEKPPAEKLHVQVKVTPCAEGDLEYGLEGDYYVSLELNAIECQFRGEKFANAVRRVVHRTLTGGKYHVISDGARQSTKPGDSHFFEGEIWRKPREIKITSIRRLVTSIKGRFSKDFSAETTPADIEKILKLERKERKTLTDSDDDTKIVSQAN